MDEVPCMRAAPETAAAFERAQEWSVASAAHTDPKGLGGVDKVEVESLRVTVKSVSNAAKQPHR